MREDQGRLPARSPTRATSTETVFGRWVDDCPRYAPGCPVYQKAIVIELLSREPSARPVCKAWRRWREGKAER